MEQSTATHDRKGCGDTPIAAEEISMGLRWDALEPGAAMRHANLDACCVLFDAQQRVLDIVTPARLRNGDGSVLHTGDSQTGAGAWDDERIFVFLDALPPPVAAVAFVAVSVTGHDFGEVPGARAHVSDPATESPYVEVDLAHSVGSVARCVALLHRPPGGCWVVRPRSQGADLAHIAESRALSACLATTGREAVAAA